jgi:HEAT repeat protein
MLHNGFRIDDYMPTWLLLQLFHDADQPVEKRWAACLSLGSKPEDVAFETLLEGLAHVDWQMRRFCIEAVKRHERARDAEAHLVPLLFDVNDQVRQTACKVCGELRLTAAHDGIRTLVGDDNPHLRDTALAALDALWREEDFDEIFARFRNDQRRAVRVAAAKTLRRHASPRTWQRLFEAWWRDREPRHRLWSCELAAQFNGTGVEHQVEALLEDRNRNVRLAAEKALRELRAA